MFQESPTRFGLRAHVIDDTDLVLRTLRRGTRQLGEPCRLTIALNGEDKLKLEEDAGDGAPRELLIDICTRSESAQTLIRALQTRPWAAPDGAVIMFPGEGGASAEKDDIGYLVRTTEVVEILQAMREALDLDLPNEDLASGMLAGQTRLDVAPAQG